MAAKTDIVTTLAGDGLSKVITLATSGTYKLPNPQPGSVCSYVLHVVHGGASPGTFIPKLAGIGVSSSEVISPVYTSVASTTAVSAGTAISAEGIYTVPCDGCDLYLVFTASTHSVTVTAHPVIG